MNKALLFYIISLLFFWVGWFNDHILAAKHADSEFVVVAREKLVVSWKVGETILGGVLFLSFLPMLCNEYCHISKS